jgi:hypothetical protein
LFFNAQSSSLPSHTLAILAHEEDIDALLRKKSFKEQQQSKTVEELLELLHRPTANKTTNTNEVWYSSDMYVRWILVRFASLV